MVKVYKKTDKIKMGIIEIDRSRVRACIEHKDYYLAMEYSILVKDVYKNVDREYFENIIKLTKIGDYEKIEKLFTKKHI